MMTLAARRAARYRGMPSHQAMLNRWFRSVSAEIWRRAAHMLRSCLPGPSDAAELLLTGEVDGRPDAGPSVDEDSDVAFESDADD